MRCIKCGWNNPDGAKVCEKCSSPLETLADCRATTQINHPSVEAVDDPRATRSVNEAPAIDMRSTSHDNRVTKLDNKVSIPIKKKSNTLWYVLVAIVVLVILAVIIWLINY